MDGRSGRIVAGIDHRLPGHGAGAGPFRSLLGRARLKDTAIRIALLATSSLLLAAADPGEPPITALTMASGGPIEAERAALRLDHVDLAIEVLPEVQRLR